jgi:hypothetical protein
MSTQTPYVDDPTTDSRLIVCFFALAFFFRTGLSVERSRHAEVQRVGANIILGVRVSRET